MAETINPSPKNTTNQTKSQKRLRLPLGAIRATKKLMVKKAGIMKRNTILRISNPYKNTYANL